MWKTATHPYYSPLHFVAIGIMFVFLALGIVLGIKAKGNSRSRDPRNAHAGYRGNVRHRGNLSALYRLVGAVAFRREYRLFDVRLAVVYHHQRDRVRRGGIQLLAGF